MKRSQLKYYLKQFSKPVSVIALTIGFVGVLIGAAGLLLAVRYGKLLSEMKQQQVTVQQQQESELNESEKSEQALPVQYQVGSGDSSWKLAALFYGDGRLYPVIEKANNLQPGEWLRVGDELIIPKLDQDHGQTYNKISHQEKADSKFSSSKNYRMELFSEKPASSEKREKYVVQPGDSLWYISLKYLGSGYSWTTLYQYNRRVVGRNPHLIYPGTELELPTPN